MCRAWGIVDPQHLPGGEGTAFVAGDVVVKPVVDTEQHSWLVQVLKALPRGRELRIIRPVRTDDGRWAVNGWAAWERLDGQPDPTRWRDGLEVSAAFHHAVRQVEWSAMLVRSHPWAVGDAVAWRERDLVFPTAMQPLAERLWSAWRPLDLPRQLIHGDLGGGNILYHAGLAPAVIDISPFWRPIRYAETILIIDAVAWAGADIGALDTLADRDGVQLVLRALLFRLATAAVICAGYRDAIAAEIAAYTPVIDVFGV